MGGHHRAVSGLGVGGDLDPTLGVGSGFEAEDLVVTEAVGGDQAHGGFPRPVMEVVDKPDNLLVSRQIPGIEDFVAAKGALGPGAVKPVPVDPHTDLEQPPGCGDATKSFAAVKGGAEHPPFDRFCADPTPKRLQLADVARVVGVDAGAPPGEVLLEAQGQGRPASQLLGAPNLGGLALDQGGGLLQLQAEAEGPVQGVRLT